jgi:hypothetical protein
VKIKTVLCPNQLSIAAKRAENLSENLAIWVEVMGDPDKKVSVEDGAEILIRAVFEETGYKHGKLFQIFWYKAEQNRAVRKWYGYERFFF